MSMAVRTLIIVTTHAPHAHGNTKRHTTAAATSTTETEKHIGG